MQLNYECENKENSKVLLKVTVDKSEVKQEYEKNLKDTQSKAEIKGFRKGKVPLSVLEMKFKKYLLSDVASKLIDDSYKEIFEKLERKPISTETTKLEGTPEATLDEDFTYEITYDAYPEYTIGDYKGIEIDTKYVADIKKSDIDEEINKIAKEFAEIKVVEDKISDTDIVKVSYKITDNDKEVDSKDNEYIHMDKDFDMYKIASFLKGKKTGDTVEFDKEFDKDTIEKVAGKKVHFTVTILEVKRETLPEINDEFAKKVNKEFDSLDALRKRIEDNMKSQAENAVNEMNKDKALEVIAKTLKADIPEIMIKQKGEEFFSSMVQQFGGDEKNVLKFLKMQNKDKDSYLEEMKGDAEKAVQEELILNKIAELEEIEPSEDELKKDMEDMATAYNMTVEKIYDTLSATGQLEVVRAKMKLPIAAKIINENLKAKKTKKVNLKDIEELQKAK